MHGPSKSALDEYQDPITDPKAVEPDAKSEIIASPKSTQAQKNMVDKKEDVKTPTEPQSSSKAPENKTGILKNPG
jgi:hypothetical protein